MTRTAAAQPKVKAIIIGGGIGGLTVAIALSKVGIDAQVYERAPVLREVGAGIVLSGMALHVLDGLGLGSALFVHRASRASRATSEASRAMFCSRFRRTNSAGDWAWLPYCTVRNCWLCLRSRSIPGGST